MSAEPAPQVLVVCDDLLFASKVTTTARAVGLGATTARTADTAVAVSGAIGPACVVVDLQLPGLDLPALLAGLRGAVPTMPRVVAFGSHVDAESLKAARQAGCDHVLPRSKFVVQLEGSLREWCVSKNAATDEHG